MSTFAPAQVTCLRCGDVFTRSLATSVNPVRAPEQRLAIMAGTFQRFTCPSCGEALEAVRPFLYVDFPRRQVIGVFAADDQSRWVEVEAEAMDAFENNVRLSPSELARSLDDGVAVRTVFGLAALREKILLNEAGLDDVVVEAVKLHLLLTSDEIDGLHALPMRVTEAWEGGITFACRVLDGDRLGTLRVDRALYDGVAQDAVVQADVLPLLAAGSYTDIGRLGLLATS